MNRREILATSVALAAVSSQVLAQGMQSHDHGQGTNGLVTAAAGCIQAGAACTSHCLERFGDASFAACARASDAMTAVAGALLKLAVNKSDQLPAIARVAMAVCQTCEQECRKHVEHAPCRACADSCAKTIAECKRVIG